MARLTKSYLSELLSILSDRVMAIPELPDDGRNLYAQVGFNVIRSGSE
jgi:hypothetical protein